MSSVSGFILRLLMILRRRGRIAGAAALAFGLIAAAWIGIAEVEAGRLQPAQPGEIAARENLKQTVHEFYDRSDFAALERLAGDLRSSGARTPSGVAKLSVYYAALHDIAASIGPGDDKGWQRFSVKLAGWQGQFTDQPTAAIAQVIALKSYAWSLRPRLIVQEAATGDDARFLAALNNARSVLDANRAVASADPQFYVLRAQLATALGEAPDQLMALTAEGRQKFPGYAAIDFSGLDYFATGDGAKAPGTEEAARIEAYVRTASADVPDEDERYARLYWHAYQLVYGDDLFRRSRADWPRMRVGMSAIAAHFPDAWNLNQFAYFACLAGDRDTTRRLLAEVSDPPPLQIWQSRAVLDGCRQWASLEPQTRR